MMRLIPITPDDAEIYASLRNGDDTYKWFFSGKKYSVDEVRQWIEKSADSGELNFFGVDGDEMVGAVSLYGLSITMPNAEVGRVMVAESKRGKGYGKKLLDGILRVAFVQGLDSVWAYIKKDNVASMKTFESAGYKLDIENGDRLKYIRPVEVR